MKRIFLSAVVILICFSNNLKAQTVKIEKAGVILSKDDNSTKYFLENVTKDSIKVVVINHQEKTEDMGNGIVGVSSGEHIKVTFTIAPKTKMSLEYIVCVHSTGLLIGSTDNNPCLLEYKFYTEKN